MLPEKTLPRCKAICLMGFMGSGKTRWGRKLASRLGLVFYDTDALVETAAGMPVADIFKHLGETHFRQLERTALEDVLSRDHAVVALGGGTPCSDENIGLLKEKGFTIYLKLNAGMLHNRLKTNKQNRPLLANYDDATMLQFIRDLLEKREPYYLQADAILEVENLTIEKLADTAVNNKQGS